MEAQFKVGDRVRYFGNITKIDRILNNGYVSLELHDELQPVPVKTKDIEPWLPRVGELCWSKYNGLVEVVAENPEGDYKIITNLFSARDRFENTFMSALEPFIGEPPSFLNAPIPDLQSAVDSLAESQKSTSPKMG